MLEFREEAINPAGVADEGSQAAGIGANVARRHQQSVAAIIDQGGCAGDVGRQDGKAAGHRLQNKNTFGIRIGTWHRQYI